MTGDDEVRAQIARRIGLPAKPVAPSCLDGLQFDAAGNVRARAGDPRDVEISSTCSQAEFERAFRKAFAQGGQLRFRGYRPPSWLDSGGPVNHI